MPADSQPNLDKPSTAEKRAPGWFFPGLIISAAVVMSGLFWFYTVVFNQFRNSSQHIALSYMPAKDIAKSTPLKKAALPGYYIKMGQYQQAIELLKTSVQTLKATGREDGLLADNLQEIGKCYLMLGNYSEAQDYYRNALIIYDKLGGKYPHKSKKEAQQDYALILKRLGQLEQAKQFESKEE